MRHTSHSKRGGTISLFFALADILSAAQAKEIEIVMPGPINVSQVQFTDRFHGVAMGIHPKGTPGSPIVWTDDGGDGWKDATIQSDLAEGEPEALFLLNDKLGWALMCIVNPRRQVLLKTEDGGKSWKQQASPELDKVRSVARMWFDRQGKCGWINPNSGPLLATTDGARSWIPVEIGKYENGPFLADGKPVPPTFEHPGMYAFSFEHATFAATPASSSKPPMPAGRGRASKSHWNRLLKSKCVPLSAPSTSRRTAAPAGRSGAKAT